MKRAIFIDKDGTLIYNVPYNANPDRIRFTKGAIEGLKQFVTAGFQLFIISNQQGVALGYFNEDNLIPVRNKLEDTLRTYEIKLSGFYYCPHNADDNCHCRKPRPGMILKAAMDHGVD